MRRRDALILGGVIAVAVAIPPILRRMPSAFDFEPLPGFDGFRRIARGGITATANPFAGLEVPGDQQPLPSVPAPRSPCLALFGPQGWGATSLPVAVFSDFNCPNCKVHEKRLFDLRDAGAPLRFVWHEMPLLGPSSLRAARAVLAARMLGAEELARAYLTDRLLRPGPAALRSLAEAIGVVPAMLQQEVEGARVSQALAQSLDLGARLGIPGTPGTVIGRTLVIGAMKQADLERLIEIELSQPQTVCA